MINDIGTRWWNLNLISLTMPIKQSLEELVVLRIDIQKHRVIDLIMITNLKVTKKNFPL